jgi:hypothetical protein
LQTSAVHVRFGEVCLVSRSFYGVFWWGRE